VTVNRTCVLLASEDMITQRIDAHLVRSTRATVSVCKHLVDGRSETPTEKSLSILRIWKSNSCQQREIECLMYDNHQKGKMMIMIMKTPGSQVDSSVAEGNRKARGR